jgi:AAA domain-containing protein
VEREDVNVSEILSRLRGVRRDGDGWRTLCPAHADRNPSLSVNVRDGKILIHCHAGCSTEAVCAAAGIEMHELFADSVTAPHIVAEYDYQNEKGDVLFQVVRFEPKDFRQRKPDGNGGWIWNLNGVRRVLYHLPDVLKAKSVLIVEGEKDCAAARKLGLVASCNPGGAGKWREEFSESLRGKRIAIIADADEPGRQHAQTIAASLHGKVESLKVLELPGVKDLTEWVDRGGTREALLELIRTVPEWKLQPEAQARSTSPWSAESMAEFLAENGAEIVALYEGLLYPETVSQIFSPRGIGKSVFALHVAIMLARSGKRVLCVDRDNPRRVIRERLRAWGAHEGLANLKIISRENCPPLTRADLWSQFPYNDYDLVILDSLDSMAEGVGEQDSAKPSRAIAPILDIARRENGPAVLVLGNCVKSAQHSRGSGVVEDRADIVFEVRDATDFHPTGSKPWVEELPAQGAKDWVSRSARRKLRQQFRLAFIATKFRLGEEPEPFMVEINTVTEPWSLRDVTDEVDREGAEARERRVRAKADAIAAAVGALHAEIVRREQAGEADILKAQAEGFLTPRGFKRKIAREAIASPVFEIAELGGKGHPKVVRLAGKNQSPGRNEGDTEPAKTLGKNDADFCRPHEQGTAEINPLETSIKRALLKPPISAEGSLFTPPERVATGPQGDVDEGEI